MTEERFIRKGYKIWDTWEDEEVYELHYRYEVDDICDMMNELIEEKEQLKSEIEKLSYANEDLLEEKRIWKQMSDEYAKLSDENEQLKKDRFICLDCEHSGYAEIGCLCEYTDNWQEYITECEDFKELKE